MDGDAREKVQEKEKAISLGGLELSRVGDVDSRFGMELEGR